VTHQTPETAKHRAGQFVNTMGNQYGSIWPFLDFQLAVRHIDVIVFRISMRWLLLFLAFFVPAVSAAVLDGRVVSVADGDTITLLDSNQQQHKIRLAGIDAPEKAQPYGQRSQQQLSELAFGKDAKADCYKVDRYDRGRVHRLR
jgi:endonuclease YncB( thermonuclease family)